jgi:hypothetical protein
MGMNSRSSEHLRSAESSPARERPKKAECHKAQTEHIPNARPVWARLAAHDRSPVCHGIDFAH